MDLIASCTRRRVSEESGDEALIANATSMLVPFSGSEKEIVKFFEDYLMR